jgi:hypothetical protein
MADVNVAVNAIREAVVAIETELGIAPSAIYPDVRTRLDAIEAKADALGTPNVTYNYEQTPISVVASGLGGWIDLLLIPGPTSVDKLAITDIHATVRNPSAETLDSYKLNVDWYFESSTTTVMPNNLVPYFISNNIPSNKLRILVLPNTTVIKVQGLQQAAGGDTVIFSVSANVVMRTI